MKSTLSTVVVSMALFLFSGLALAQSSKNCTCGGQTYKGTCAPGQIAVSCDCKTITLICQKATGTKGAKAAKAAKGTKGTKARSGAVAAKAKGAHKARSAKATKRAVKKAAVAKAAKPRAKTSQPRQ